MEAQRERNTEAQDEVAAQGPHQALQKDDPPVRHMMGIPFNDINRGNYVSLRDDTSSLAPPPQYEEFASGAERRASEGAPLPSYASVKGSLPEKQETGISAFDDVFSPATTTSTHYPPEKTEGKEKGVPERSTEQSLAAVSTTRLRSRADLSAISDAISRVYASSPSLDNQRATPLSSSRPTSRSGVTDDDPERNRLSGKLSGLFGLSGDLKGKRRETRTRLGEAEETVEVEGKRMSRTMAKDLFQIWDNIDRAHGQRMNDQSQEHDTDTEAAKLEGKKQVFYQELVNKTGQGRLVSQEYIGTSEREQSQLLDRTLNPGAVPLAEYGNCRHSYQALQTSGSEQTFDQPHPSLTRASANDTVGHSSGKLDVERLQEDTPQATVSAEELVTLKGFFQGTERELVSVRDFFKHEYGKHK
ncbi:hypothetical protein NliqN6_3032 [Naganishia liquefaciens]|uniref:Uncharacterized protein n=1 Tax=Naganishia liquefaciens TaxID=104408 RepID=A0A8H3TSX8_9TREE|nr:hypothetical protein NliqN6_3032 [Naganishia liquefaciens]